MINELNGLNNLPFVFYPDAAKTNTSVFTYNINPDRDNPPYLTELADLKVWPPLESYGSHIRLKFNPSTLTLNTYNIADRGTICRFNIKYKY